MNDSSSFNNAGVSRRKRHNSESYLKNSTVSGNKMKMEHKQVDFRNISSRSKSHDALQSSPLEDPQFHNSSEENSENSDWCTIAFDDRSVKRPPLFEAGVSSPDYFSDFLFERSDISSLSASESSSVFSSASILSASESVSVFSSERSDISSLSASESDLLLSENNLSPDRINSSEQNENIENYPPTFIETHCFPTIQESSGSIIVNNRSQISGMAFNQKPIALNERPCKLPGIPWGECSDFWKMICDKDSATLTYRNPDYFKYHENITPKMRAIVLEWLIEVSILYKLHRETYYLAMDYFDRYLSNCEPISTDKLQLIGITCLLVATKKEEIYIPKVHAFSLLTGGLCTVADLVDMEEKLLMCLRFRLSPISINYWVELMLQSICVDDISAENSLIIPQFPQNFFVQVTHLLDFACLDARSLRYSYSELAASALTIVYSKTIALFISGLSEGNICGCVEWMSVYWSVIIDEFQYKKVDLKNDKKLVDATHVKLYNSVTMDLYDMAERRFEILQLSRV